MTYPYKTPKIRGFVESLDDRYVWVRITLDSVELQAVVYRSQFGPDANKLQEGSLISRPGRRKSRWMLTPIPPWTEIEVKRAKAKGRIWANRMQKLFVDNRTNVR